MSRTARIVVFVVGLIIHGSGCVRAHRATDTDDSGTPTAPEPGPSPVTPPTPDSPRLPPASVANAPALPEPRSLSPRMYCAPRPTTFIDMAANLGRDDAIPSAWDANDPAGTSNCSVQASIYDRFGTPCDVTFYFRNAGASVWELHGLIGGSYTEPGDEIVSATLVFTEDGALHHVWTSPMTLPGIAGAAATPIDLRLGTSIIDGGDGLEGITQLNAPSTVTRLDRDGRTAGVGVACEDGSVDAVPSDPRAPAAGNALTTLGTLACASDPTRSIHVTTNLHAGAEMHDAPWNAHDPSHTSNAWAELALVSDTGVHAAIALYFRRVASQRWEYRAWLRDDSTGDALTSGTLAFTAAGALQSHTVEQPLRFPNPDGSWGDVIDLSFGPTLDDGGNGVDGTTGFHTAFAGLDVAVRGSGARLDAPCPTRASTSHARFRFADEAPPEWPFLEPVLPRCAGVVTRRISASISLPPDAPLATITWDPRSPERDAYMATTTIFDSTASPWTLSLYFRRLIDTQWDYHALLQGEDGTVTHIGTSTLSFGDFGVLDALGPMLSFRLPLADGSDGPLITVDLGDPGSVPTSDRSIYNVTTWSQDFSGQLYADGRVEQGPDSCAP